MWCGSCLTCRFGVVLWEILTKESPVRGRLVWPAERCPPGVRELFVVCTSANAATRPTAPQLLNRLLGL